MIAYRAHPRVSGENIWGSPTAGVYKGSSPRERGKPCPGSPQTPARWLIPA